MEIPLFGKRGIKTFSPSLSQLLPSFGKTGKRSFSGTVSMTGMHMKGRFNTPGSRWRGQGMPADVHSLKVISIGFFP